MAATSTVPGYEQHRPVVLRVLARRCSWLDPGDREALFHDAYAVMLAKERGGELEPMAPEQTRAYLIQTALFKALDEGKRAGRRRSVSLDDETFAIADPGNEPDDLVATSMDNERLREIIAELPRRRQTIVKLRFFFDRTPAEIQRFLGITERTYRKELERALRQVADAYRLVREGGFCESRRSLILAYVAGIAGPNRAVEARRHLQTCPACAHWAVELREGAERVAALLPPVPVLAWRRPSLRFADSWASLRDGAERVLVTVKHHGASLTASSDTPSYLAALRPGTVTAVVAGCIAVGGGATTYCLTNGVPGPLAIATHHAQKAKHEPPKRHRTPQPRRTAATPPVTPPAATPRKPPQRKAPAHRASTHSSSSAASRDPDEFGFEPVPSSNGSAASASGGGAPQSPGEFDP